MESFANLIVTQHTILDFWDKGVDKLHIEWAVRLIQVILVCLHLAIIDEATDFVELGTLKEHRIRHSCYVSCFILEVRHS